VVARSYDKDGTKTQISQRARWLQFPPRHMFLDEQLIDHSLRKAHRPQGGGKIESVIGTVQRELWEVVQFDSVEEAERALVTFLPTVVTAARTWGSAAWCPPGRMGRGRVVWLQGFRRRDAEIRASSATHARRPRWTARSLRACPVVGRGRRRVRPSIVRLSPSTGSRVPCRILPVRESLSIMPIDDP
jgi:hypothetical protein